MSFNPNVADFGQQGFFAGIITGRQNTADFSAFSNTAGGLGEMFSDAGDRFAELGEVFSRLGDVLNDLGDALERLGGPSRSDSGVSKAELEEALDDVADGLGALANDVDDQGLAGDINRIESRLRRALADGDTDADSLDAIADDLGRLVNDVDDQDLAAKLNALESDLRAAIAGGPSTSSGDNSSNLTTPDDNTIDTGRFTIAAKKDEVIITDKETGETIRAWGDPHLVTSDGDKAQFHEDNLTIDLPDGTKVTIQPTEKNSRGLSYIDRVAVTNDNGQAVVMSGIHDNDISHTGVMTGEGVADGVDRSFDDGTVLETGDQIDDLWFTDDNGDRTKEIVGEDRTQRFNEWMLDGMGGASDIGPDR